MTDSMVEEPSSVQVSGDASVLSVPSAVVFSNEQPDVDDDVEEQTLETLDEDPNHDHDHNDYHHNHNNYNNHNHSHVTVATDGNTLGSSTIATITDRTNDGKTMTLSGTTNNNNNNNHNNSNHNHNSPSLQPLADIQVCARLKPFATPGSSRAHARPKMFFATDDDNNINNSRKSMASASPSSSTIKRKTPTLPPKTTTDHRRSSVGDDSSVCTSRSVATMVGPPRYAWEVRSGNSSSEQEEETAPGQAETPSSSSRRQAPQHTLAQSSWTHPDPSRKHAYTFDRVFGPDATTPEMYTQFLGDLVRRVVYDGDGTHGSVFCYGHRDTGKTHTLQGTTVEPGILPLTVADCFRNLAEQQQQSSSQAQHVVKFSYLEIYNETVIDLLSNNNTTHNTSSTSSRIKILENSQGQSVVRGVVEEVVKSPPQVYDLVRRGERNRHFHHHKSSSTRYTSHRGHVVARIIIEREENKTNTNGTAGTAAVTRRSRFSSLPPPMSSSTTPPKPQTSYVNIIDLAGTESSNEPGKYKVNHERQLESIHINKSLMTLGHVIFKLSESGATSSSQSNTSSPTTTTNTNRQRRMSSSSTTVTQPLTMTESNNKSGTGTTITRHVPYRDSKLTRLLQPSLSSKNAHVRLIVHISPKIQHLEDSHGALQFASRAKSVTHTKCNTDPALLRRYREELYGMKFEYRKLKKRRTELQKSTNATATTTNTTTTHASMELHDSDTVDELADIDVRMATLRQSILNLERIILKYSSNQWRDTLISSAMMKGDDDGQSSIVKRTKNNRNREDKTTKAKDTPRTNTNTTTTKRVAAKTKPNKKDMEIEMTELNTTNNNNKSNSKIPRIKPTPRKKHPIGVPETGRTRTSTSTSTTTSTTTKSRRPVIERQKTLRTKNNLVDSSKTSSSIPNNNTHRKTKEVDEDKQKNTSSSTPSPRISQRKSTTAKKTERRLSSSSTLTTSTSTSMNGGPKTSRDTTKSPTLSLRKSKANISSAGKGTQSKSKIDSSSRSQNDVSQTKKKKHETDCNGSTGSTIDSILDENTPLPQDAPIVHQEEVSTTSIPPEPELNVLAHNEKEDAEEDDLPSLDDILGENESSDRMSVCLETVQEDSEFSDGDDRNRESPSPAVAEEEEEEEAAADSLHHHTDKNVEDDNFLSTQQPQTNNDNHVSLQSVNDNDMSKTTNDEKCAEIELVEREGLYEEEMELLLAEKNKSVLLRVMPFPNNNEQDHFELEKSFLLDSPEPLPLKGVMTEGESKDNTEEQQLQETERIDTSTNNTISNSLALEQKNNAEEEALMVHVEVLESIILRNT